MTATTVPMCRAVSKAFSKPWRPAKSCQPSSHGATIRCPLEEMGRNSASPWTMPRTMAWMIGTSARLGRGNDPCPPRAGLVVVAALHDGRAESLAERGGVGEIGYLDVGRPEGAGDVGIAARTLEQAELGGEGA